MPPPIGRTRSICSGRTDPIRVASLNSGDMTVRVAGVDRSESHPPARNVHTPLVEDFVEAVRTGRAPAVDGHVGRAVAAVQDAIYADAPSVR